ncbi:hypothetical protein E4T39_01471 [Aureobasidium subglaciale]|nr:hypothetical protein E4T39_01471 [Aureobasidium subglaciale]
MHLSDKDILSINHTNSALHTKTRLEFASRFLTDLTFPLTKTGAENMHTFSLDQRRRYVKTIIIVLTVEDHFRALEYLEVAVQNINAFYNLDSLGLRRDFDERIITKYDTTYSDISVLLKDIFLHAATNAQLPLHNVIFEIEAPDLIRPITTNSDKVYMSQLERELKYTSGLLSAFHDQQPTRINFVVRFVKEGTAGSSKSPSMTYNRGSSSIKGDGLGLNHIRAMTPWMKTKSGFKEVILLNSEFDYSTFREICGSTTLESLTMRNIRLLDRQVAGSTPWDRLLGRLRLGPALTYCQVGQLWHSNKASFTASTWQTYNRVDTLALLFDLATKTRSRPAFKLEMAAPRTMPAKTQKRKSKAKSKAWSRARAKKSA